MARFPETATNADAVKERVYSQLVERAAAASERMFPLHVGDTHLEPPMAARAESQRSRDLAGLHRYGPTQGQPELVDAVVERLASLSGGAVRVPRDAVQIMPGATAGLNIVCQTLLDPGDEMIILAPFWPLIRGMCQIRGAKAVEVPFFTELDRADFDATAALEAAVSDRTVAIYVNTPHNPTSRVLPDDVLTQIAAFAERHGLWVLSDEAYQDLWLGDEAPTPVWARPDMAARTIATHTMSKSYGLAGARVGYTHGPMEVMQRIRGMQTFMNYCAAVPMQYGALRALREGGAFLAQCRAAYRDAGRLAADALGVAPPQGGTFLFVDAAPLLDERTPDVDALLERCADVGVLLAPGRSMGDAYANSVRLCYTAVAPDALEEAMNRIAPFFTRE